MNDTAKPLRPLGYVNKKILESAGDLGVPRVQKAAPTAVKEFNLSSSARPTTARKKVDVPDDSTRPLYSSFGSKAGAAKFARPSVVAKPKPPPAKAPAAKAPTPKPVAALKVPASKAAAAAPKPVEANTTDAIAAGKALASAVVEDAIAKVEEVQQPVDVSEAETTTTDSVGEAEKVEAEEEQEEEQEPPIMDAESAWVAAHEEKALRDAILDEEEAWVEAHKEEARREAILAEPLDPMDAAWVEAHYDNEFRKKYGAKAHNDAMAMDAWDEAYEEKARREAAEEENKLREWKKDELPAYLIDADAEDGECSEDEEDADYAPTPKQIKTKLAFAAIKTAATPVAKEEAEVEEAEVEEAKVEEAKVEEAPPSATKKMLASPAKAGPMSPAVRQSPRRQPQSATKAPPTNEEKLTEAIKALLTAEPGMGVKKIVEKLQEVNLGFEVSAKAVRVIRQQM